MSVNVEDLLVKDKLVLGLFCVSCGLFFDFLLDFFVIVCLLIDVLFVVLNFFRRGFLFMFCIFDFLLYFVNNDILFILF